jgi:ABC-type uncharacterized transport system ATPase subunit
VRAGEILGICGIDGNGQTELIGAITGLIRGRAGRILFRGRDIAGHAYVKQRLDLGLGHIPEDRQKHGLILDFRWTRTLVVHPTCVRRSRRAGVSIGPPSAPTPSA